MIAITMEQDNQANVERLKDEVLQVYGVNPQREDLPNDVRRWVELIHEHLTSEELTVSWLMEQPGLSKKRRTVSSEKWLYHQSIYKHVASRNRETPIDYRQSKFHENCCSTWV